MMMRVIERATGIEMRAEAIDGGYQVFTLDGEKYKKLRESTFKKYFKEIAEEQPNANEVSAEKREKMIEKIKKMMALAENNPSEEEALSAALQAHKLMMKYNIHESEVTLEEVKEDIVSIFTEQKHNCLIGVQIGNCILLYINHIRSNTHIHKNTLKLYPGLFTLFLAAVTHNQTCLF